MVQRKKEGVRDAILAAAFGLFAEKGYSDTSLPAIARAAHISTANVYVYFDSKLDVLFTLYEPWLGQRLDQLERKLRRVADPTLRLQRLLLAIWRDLPRESNGFANNVMQAVSTSGGSAEYSPRLREMFQARVAGWIRDCLQAPADECDMMASVVLMAFDGFAMNVRLVHGVACDEAIARLFSQLFARPAGRGAADGPRGRARR